MSRTHLTAVISLFVASTVLLSSLHAVQVWGAAATSHDDAKKITHDEVSAKAVSDLHHHSDKSGTQLIKDAGDHQQLIDNRSLRLLRDKKETIRHKLARWQQAWEEFIISYHLL